MRYFSLDEKPIHVSFHFVSRTQLHHLAMVILRLCSKVADRSKDTITSANNLKRGGKMKKRGLIIDLQKLQKLSYEREDSLNARAVISKGE